jgi:hypothetical protein
MVQMIDDKLRILCKKCGKLRPKEAFKANYKGRVCTKRFEPLAEATIDLVKHVQGLYEKKKPANRR